MTFRQLRETIKRELTCTSKFLHMIFVMRGSLQLRDKYNRYVKMGEILRSLNLKRPSLSKVIPSANRISIHQVIGWWFGGQSKSPKSIHYKIDPEELQ